MAEKNQNKEKTILKRELKKEQDEVDKIKKDLHIMESKIPEAMTGTYPLSLEELVQLIKKRRADLEKQEKVVQEKELALQNTMVSVQDWEELKQKIPTWQEVFLNADTSTKRVLVNRLIKRIDVKKDEITVHFKINLDEFFVQPRICVDSGTIPYKPDSA
ncbi:MAG TPA: hypothetical protein H9753_12140 [Candidatus Blautia merdavium]|uniref:Uncharacterized protein n=1 Tax=Candidatus Blautia merdavium TaxID=2838494 RepID=A0A9D2TCS9_9FIRM|nr:hypothetical protein [Candidatus Blautia merdavium]